MSVTNPETGTNVHEIADRIYRISTPIDLPDGRRSRSTNT